MMVIFTQNQAAKDLWEFGEDTLATKAKKLSDDELKKIHKIVDKNWTLEVSKLIGKQGKTLDLGTVTAVTLVQYFEGKIRPLARSRRRAASTIPAKYNYKIEEELKLLSKFHVH